MEKHPSSQDQSSYVFNIEVLVEGTNNAAALEKLLHVLNNVNFVDFRILSGIKLGEHIEHRIINASSVEPIPLQLGSEANESLEALSYFDKIRALITNNTLIRLFVNKGLGLKLSIPCRVINLDEAENFITVYHVDEKQVYTFQLNEIEDFSY